MQDGSVSHKLRLCVNAVETACGWHAAIVASFSTSLVKSATFDVTYSSVDDLEPSAASKCLLPCRVIRMPSLRNRSVAGVMSSSLTISHVLVGFTK